MASDNTADAVTKRPRRRSVSARLQTLDVDGGNGAAKRAREVEAELIADLSMHGLFEVPAHHRQLIRRCAMLSALAEDPETRLLAGEETKRSEYLTLVNAQRRAFEALGLTADAQ